MKKGYIEGHKIYNVTMKNQTNLYKYFNWLKDKNLICERELRTLRSIIKVNYKKYEDITNVLEKIILDYKIDDFITFRILRLYNIVRLSYNYNYTQNDLIEVVKIRLEKNHDLKVHNEKIKNVINFRFYNRYNNLI